MKEILLLFILVIISLNIKSFENLNLEQKIIDLSSLSFIKKEESLEELQELPVKEFKTKREILINDYIEKYKEIAIDEQEKYGILASITLSQGVLESNAGQSPLSVKHNNHFGMKWRKGRKEKYAVYADDSPTDKFVVYTSDWWSYRDHSRLLYENERYRFLFDCKDYKCWANGLQKAGYATSKNYAKNLISIIEKYDLTRFDK